MLYFLRVKKFHTCDDIYTFSPAKGRSLRLLQRTEKVVQEVEESLQYTTVTQGSLANAGQEHEHPGIQRNVKRKIQ